jgi:hypothetical protein
MVVHVAVRGLIVFVTMPDIVVIVAMSRIRALRHRCASLRWTSMARPARCIQPSGLLSRYARAWP